MKLSAFILPCIIIGVVQISCNSNSRSNNRNEIKAGSAETMMNASLQTSDNKKKETDSQDDNSRVVINGITLDKFQIEELKKIYGAEPKAGNYWYDSKSGLYGVTGYPAFG